MGSVPNKVKKRLAIGFSIVCVLMTLLCFRIGWHQIVRGDEYSKMAVEQQTKDVPIEAKRGSILDRNGEELATSAVCYSVWARPAQVRTGKNEEEKEENLTKCVKTLSGILGTGENEIRAMLTKDQSLVKIAKYLDRNTADKIRNESLYGIEIAEDVKRHYPLGNFASNLLGSVTDDNNGLSGIELRYNQYLSGTSGRWIKNTDRNGNGLSYGVEKYYKPEDGMNVVLTIDEVIQHYAEKGIKNAVANTKADRALCLVMDPRTGDILAMASTPGYDPNEPRTPVKEEDQNYLKTLPDNEKLEYWNRMWRNPVVSDVYEPGSTSKLLTTAMALEEGLTRLDEQFYCNGSYKVADRVIKCWRSNNPHGAETLVQAVGNSCNPVLVQLALRVGTEKFYEYLDLLGMTKRTGIDFPGEAYPLVQDQDTAGPVGLATMSFGQGIAVSMVQQLAAICVFGNDGKLMQPRLIKALTDSDGNVVKEFEKKEVRQVFSEKTVSEMCLIMESVVKEGGAKGAAIPGYRIGGKTGTSQRATAKGYSNEVDGSFLGMAPMDDPKVAILVVVNNPKTVRYGSTAAIPPGREILLDTLRYLKIKPEYTQDEITDMNNSMAVVPELTGDTFGQAEEKLANAGLLCTISPTLSKDDPGGHTVVDQYPKAGEKLNRGGTVYIYWE